jgi:Tol biopolymer transport system component
MVVVAARALLICALAAAAGSARAATLAGHGLALISHDHVLATRDLRTGVERELLRLPNTDFVFDPLWSNDGRSIYFVDQKTYTGDQSADWGSDVWRTDANGGNRRMLLAHDAKGADVDGLALTPDGRALLFGYTRTDIGPTGAVLDQVIQVRRLDLSGGSIATVVDQALDPAISPDGASLVYLYAGAPDADSFGLWISGSDGSDPRPLAVGAQGLLSFFTPRFSPDGSRVLFTAAVNTLSDRFGTAFRYGRAADGLPQDAWVVNADGTGLTRLTTLNEDQPAAGWSADGSQIALLGQGGLYLIRADGSDLTRLGDGYLHGELGWYDGGPAAQAGRPEATGTGSFAAQAPQRP